MRYTAGHYHPVTQGASHVESSYDLVGHDLVITGAAAL